jgi:hypothetical protein
MIGFFLRLSKTAVSPSTERVRALASQEFGDEPYRGVVGVGVWFKENRHGNKGV